VKTISCLTIVFASLFLFNSCQRDNKDSIAKENTNQKNARGNITPNFPQCPDGYAYCLSTGSCEPIGSCDGGSSDDINNFINSMDFNSFSTSNPILTSKISYDGAQVRNDYNQLLAAELKTIHFPVIESNGDTSGVVIGIPNTENGITNYVIVYQNNQSLIRDAFGYYYGEIGMDVYNSTISYSAQFSSSSELISDTLVSGPRWITNFSCSTCKLVKPTGTCIDAVMDKFWDRCHGGCRFWCRFSDTFAFGTCTGGQYLGAAYWCASNNNNSTAY